MKETSLNLKLYPYKEENYHPTNLYGYFALVIVDIIFYCQTLGGVNDKNRGL